MSDILIVDDKESIRTLVKLCLEVDGHRVFRALDVTEALGVVEVQSIDLVITDFYMPGKSGLELIQDLKCKYPEVRIIFITGFGADVLELAKENGAAATLEKPFSMDQLRTVVKDVLQDNGLDPGLRRRSAHGNREKFADGTSTDH